MLSGNIPMDLPVSSSLNMAKSIIAVSHSMSLFLAPAMIEH